MSKKVLVIGGVAGGASFAARARRLNEQATIMVVERGGYVSFANCGLPYHIGGEIAERGKLLLNTPETLRARFNLDVRVKTEARSIDRARRIVTLRELSTNRTYEEQYDELVLAPGASPIVPNIPGINSPRVHTLRSIEDLDRVIGALSMASVRSVAVIGGGYIGVEVAEQLLHRSLKVTLIEAAPQLLAPLDPEMAILVEDELRRLGVTVIKGDPLSSLQDNGTITAIMASGARSEVDLVLLAIGVRPEVGLARDAGIAIGPRGGIVVDRHLRTNDPHVWAVGDAIEVPHLVTGEVAPIPLAGPANRQGRMVADNIFRPEGQSLRSYRGSLGTAIVRVGNLTAACTGANEKTLTRLKMSHRVHYLFPNQHAGYFPGAKSLAIKVLVDPERRTLLGAQIVGQEGADKRIDVLATAIMGGLSIDQIAELELAYAPPYGSAKDPVNFVGMIAQNELDDLVQTITPAELFQLRSGQSDALQLVDVRDARERAAGAIPDSIHIPLNELRSRLTELKKEVPTVVFCASALRSYNAARILGQAGFPVRNLSGAMRAWDQFIRSRESA
jgi:NADPH-dependent 2,4-dienoyl-CoA reductase/sulfur reductase-like enzyme/rhodanese-related sulfurtransferase